MSYLDRLRPAQYTSPSGVVTSFKFKELKRSRSHKAATKELPQQDTADTQDLGMASTHLPMELTIFGVDYDKVADDFWDSLGEFGPGTLSHPRWDDISVLPISIEQVESFIDGARCAVFTVEFLRVANSPAIKPAATQQPSVANTTQTARQLAASEFAGMYKPQDALQKSLSINTMSRTVAMWPASISSITSSSPGLIAQISTKVQAISTQIANGITDTGKFFTDTLDMMRVPSAADLPVLQKLKAFAYSSAALAGSLLALPQSISEAAVKSVAFFGSFVGVVEAALNGQITNRADAVAAADLLIGQYNDLIGTIEVIESAVPQFAFPIDVLIAAKQAASDAKDALIAQSFSLPTQRRMTLDSTETLITLSFRLFGNLDHIEDLETWNVITGDEYWLIPIGRAVVWYE